jgi:hypothetical protein
MLKITIVSQFKLDSASFPKNHKLNFIDTSEPFFSTKFFYQLKFTLVDEYWLGFSKKRFKKIGPKELSIM